MKTYRYRLYPNKTQATLINKTLGCARFVYNHFLGKRIEIYQATKESLSYNQCCSELTGLKTKLEWLKEVDSIALQQSLRNLEQAYKNFFKGSGFPKFKKNMIIGVVTVLKVQTTIFILKAIELSCQR